MENYHAHTIPAILYRYSVEQRCLQMADPWGPRQETPGMKLYLGKNFKMWKMRKK